MKTRLITWTVVTMMVGGTLSAKELSLKNEAADSFVLTTTAVLGALGTAAGAAALGAAGAIGSGIVGLIGSGISKLLSKGVEPAVAKNVAEAALKEAANEVLDTPVASGNTLSDSISLSSGAADAMVMTDDNDPEAAPLVKAGIPRDKVRMILAKARAKIDALNDLVQAK